MSADDILEGIVTGFELAGVITIVLGGVFALLDSAIRFQGLDSFYVNLRRGFGRPLILGLEILVAADIIDTITVEETIESAIGLAIIVLVRIALTFSLDVEIDGMVPWSRTKTDAELETMPSETNGSDNKS
jgi:uncharacterized membrane protein